MPTKAHRRFKAIIFDMDGLLVDSEPLWAEAQRTLLRRRGLSWDPELFRRMMGRRPADAMRTIQQHYRLTGDTAALTGELIADVLQLYRQGVPLRPGAHDLVAAVAPSHRLAIASSSPREIIETVVALCGWDRLFGVLCSGDEVPRGKPAPDVFLAAATALDVSPVECLVLEDSPTGVAAALAADMTCYAVPSQELFTAADFPCAHAIIESLVEVLPLLDGRKPLDGHGSRGQAPDEPGP
ncbi:MAG: HAD family phosphatase [Chloroflexi bacterium]|nr:HAD family phosphatase [Chloroflexota bacterium]